PFFPTYFTPSIDAKSAACVHSTASCARAVAGMMLSVTGIDAFEKSAHAPDRSHRNRFNAVKAGDSLHFLPRRQLHRFAYRLGNDNLEFRRNGRRFHEGL